MLTVHSKVCRKCGECKSLDDFHKSHDGRLGRRPDCKSCASASQAARRAGNADARADSWRAWYAKNRARRAQYGREWRAANPDYYGSERYRRANVERQARRRARKREAASGPSTLTRSGSTTAATARCVSRRLTAHFPTRIR